MGALYLGVFMHSRRAGSCHDVGAVVLREWRMMIDPRPIEVEWYRQHGQHPQRIARDSSGAEYVIGDSAWNARHTWAAERVEAKMRREVARREAK